MADETVPQTCLLLKVPAEILDRITWHLTTTELCDLRLTCKAVEAALHFRFTAEFFTRKQFMVSEFSLKALRDIAKSRFASHLRHVHFGLDRLEANAHLVSTTSTDITYHYQKRLTEQSTLWQLGLVPKYLAEAFSHLPNLESVVIRDFNSNRRSRDGPHRHWLSYGTNTLQHETNVRPRPAHIPSWSNPPLQEDASRLFKAIVHGLGMAKARPKALEVMERQGNLVYDSCFHIHPDLEADVVPVLRALKRLHLCIDVAWVAVATTNNINQHFYQYSLIEFLQHCESLEELRINGKRTDIITSHTRVSLHLLFDWLATTEWTTPRESTPATASRPARTPLPPVIEPSPEPEDEPMGIILPLLGATYPQYDSKPTLEVNFPPVHLAHLANLSLGMMSLSVTEIVNLVTKLANTLQFLELWRIQLVPEPGADDMVVDKRAILYVQLLKKLLAVPNLNLRHIKLGMLQQILTPTRQPRMVQDVDFKVHLTKSTDVKKAIDPEQPAQQEPIATSREMQYTGSDWRHFVSHEMLPRLYINWRLPGKHLGHCPLPSASCDAFLLTFVRQMGQE